VFRVAAIEQALDAETTPLRLQLGADSVAAVRSHAETLLADLSKWEPMSRGTSFTSQPAWLGDAANL
jgi:hypothetical protein